MLEEQIPLITILKEVISDYEEKILHTNIPKIVEYKSQIDSLKKDINYILEIDLNIIKEILSEYKEQLKEYKDIYQYMSTIKSLLKLNKEKHTTYKLQPNQLAYIKNFIKELEKLEKENQKEIDKNIQEKEKFIETKKQYEELLNQIEDKTNFEYISNIKILTLLWNECEIDESTKRDIIISIMKYNQNMFNQTTKKEASLETI